MATTIVGVRWVGQMPIHSVALRQGARGPAAGLPSRLLRRASTTSTMWPGQALAKGFAQTENRMAFVVPPLPAHLELRDLLVAALAVGGFLPAVLCLHRLALRLVPGRDAALRRVKRA